MPENPAVTQSTAMAMEEIRRRISTNARRAYVSRLLMKLILHARRTDDGLALIPIGSHMTPTVTEAVPGSFLLAASSGSAQLLRTYARGEWSTVDLYTLLSSLWRIEQILRKARLAAWPIDRSKLAFRRLSKGGIRAGSAQDYSDVSMHYDLARELFEAFLGSGLAYSAAELRHEPERHDAAYEAFYNEILRNLLGVQSPMTIVDLGCGWGAFSRHVLDYSGHSVYAITISGSQAEYLQQALAQYIPKRLNIVHGNFMEVSSLPDHADAIVMIETIEHVDRMSRQDLFKRLSEKYPSAKLLLQFTAAPDWADAQKSGRATAANSVIFPGPAELPTVRQIMTQAKRAGYQVVRSEDLTAEYSAVTLAWRSRFLRRYEELAEYLPKELLLAWDFYLTGLTTGLGQRAVLNYQLILVKRGE